MAKANAKERAWCCARACFRVVRGEHVDKRIASPCLIRTASVPQYGALTPVCGGMWTLSLKMLARTYGSGTQSFQKPVIQEWSCKGSYHRLRHNPSLCAFGSPGKLSQSFSKLHKPEWSNRRLSKHSYQNSAFVYDDVRYLKYD